jgi:hypothetical protein
LRGVIGRKKITLIDKANVLETSRLWRNDHQIIKNLDLSHLIGIDLNSKFELEPGKKDVKKLNTFLNKINENI